MIELEKYSIESLKLADDYEGTSIATLIGHPKNGSNSSVVLYIHGFVDYFFQTHVAEYHIANGIDFFALDLRKYGRSLLPHQKANNARDISEYFEEISLSIAKLTKEYNYAKVLLSGHSTGGLIASLYANEGGLKQKLNGIVLNSPFFAFNLPAPLMKLIPGIARIGKINPDQIVETSSSGFYVKSLHKKYYGEWDFDLSKKPFQGFPVYSGWVNAIYEAHRKVSDGLSIAIPVLILHSNKSSKMTNKWNPTLLTSDYVLDVEKMKAFYSRLGNNVTSAIIPDAMHDVFLSSEKVRTNAFGKLFAWYKVNLI